MVAQQVAREQLEVLEVERRLALLAGRGTRRRRGRAAPGAGPCRASPATSSAACSTRLARLLVARRARRRARAAAPGRSAARAATGRSSAARAASTLRLASRRGSSSRRCAASRKSREQRVEVGQRPELERRAAGRPSAASRRRRSASGAGRVAAVRREQPQPRSVARGAERGERAVERLAADHRAVLLVELAEARVDPDRERMRAQEPRAEAVDGRDPRAVEPPREVVRGRARAAPRGSGRAARPPPCACR